MKCEHNFKCMHCKHTDGFYGSFCKACKACVDKSNFECKLCKKESEMNKQAIYRVMINNNGRDWRFYSEKYKSEDEAVGIVIKEIVKGYDMTKFKVVEDIPLNIELIHKGR